MTTFYDKQTFEKECSCLDTLSIKNHLRITTLEIGSLYYGKHYSQQPPVFHCTFLSSDWSHSGIQRIQKCAHCVCDYTHTINFCAPIGYSLEGCCRRNANQNLWHCQLRFIAKAIYQPIMRSKTTDVALWRNKYFTTCKFCLGQWNSVKNLTLL